MTNIRNFCIIAHIDHGKSTLADRFLELTKTIPSGKMRQQFLDQMELERERGITIKLQPVQMKYKNFVLNLIDTPGHMDFYLEVERSLKAVEGAVLLVDAVKGVQAQTLSNLSLAQEQNLKIIPVINKIDLPSARIPEVEEELVNLLKINKDKIIKISAKNGTNVEQVLEAIIKNIPSPKGSSQAPVETLVFDSSYDSYKGVIAYLRVLNGSLKGKEKEVGIFKPQLTPTDELKAGEIGYLATGEKNLEKYLEKIGWRIPQPMVFASFYPQKDSDFNVLKEAINKLKLNDPAFSSEVESLPVLGRGFKCGFLGMLHLEIVAERLKREHNLNLVITSPRVNYQIFKKEGVVKEPWASLEIVVPQTYLGQTMDILKQLRGKHKGTEFLSGQRLIINYDIPLADIIINNFYDKLKSVTSGYASMSYKIIGLKEGDLVKLEVLIAKELVEELSQIIPRSQAENKARQLAMALKNFIPKQNFVVSIQIILGDIFGDKQKKTKTGRIIAREDIPALRKDVTGHLYGGDYTRKRKLLEKQKRGKKKMKALGKVNIPSDVFLKLLK